MNVRMEYEAENVDWECVSGMLRAVGMAHYSSDVHRRAFLNSYFAVFVFDDRRLVAIGRMISDGEYQSAIYDVAVLPEYQGCGIGKQIIRRLKQETPNCNFVLYATPGKEAFYKKEGFKKLKTGMAVFVNQASMQAKGFIE